MTLLTSSIIVSINELFKFILLILTLYTARFYFRYFTRKNKVPGPLPFPFFGTMPYSYIVGQYRFLNYCYEKYGTLFEIYVGDDLNTNREIYICKPELLEKIFSSSTKSNFLLRSPNNEGMNEFGFGKSGMVVNSDLSSWRRNRMLSVPLLMNAGFLKTQVHVIQELFQEMENYWKLLHDKNDEKIILDFTSWMHRFALDVVITSSLGRSSYSLKSFYNTFTQSDGTIEKNENTSSIEYDSSDLLIRQVKSFFKALLFVKHPSWLRHTFLIYYNNFYLNEINSLNNSIENFIKLRREEILLEIKNGKNVQEDRRDIMSLFLLKYSTITDEVIRSNLIEIFIGGNETVSSSIGFIMYYLCKYPHVKNRLIDEIDVILSSNILREITFEDIEKFEYAEALIKEVTRLTPISPLIARSNVVEDELGEYTFEAGTKFYAFMIQIYKNPEYFTNPEEFNPDRFLKGSEKISRFNTLLQFGSGLRMCPGRQSAMTVIKTFLMCFFRKYDAEFADENQELKISFDVSFHCGEYKIAIKKR